jgi:serine/threonine-protein kinase HipA
VKLPSQRFPRVPENEYAMMSLAQWVGIEIPEIELVSIDSIANLPAFDFRGEGSAIALKRFDRSDAGERVHMEDFAQVFGVYPERKYGEASYRNIRGDRCGGAGRRPRVHP